MLRAEAGGLSGLAINKPPHLLIPDAWKNLLIYSEEYFAVPPRKMGITCPDDESDTLRALCVYLGSSLADFFVFFHVPQWGIYSDHAHRRPAGGAFDSNAGFYQRTGGCFGESSPGNSSAGKGMG